MLEKILTVPTEQFGRASRFLVFQVKLWWHCAKLLTKNRAGQQAAALSYHTIFGLVPLAVVTLLIFQSIPAYTGVGDKVKGVVYKQLHLSTIEYPDPANPEAKVQLTEHLDRIIGRVFDGLNEGTIALVSTVLIIWAALALLSTIEKAFNNIWHVGKGRDFLHRIINYWAILTLGPLLLGAGIYVTTRYTFIGQIEKTILSNIAPAVLSYVVAVVAFFLLYFVLPNTKVRAKAAIFGAMVAALAWSLAKWGFGLYVIKLIPYSQVYGVLGLIPLGIFWIFITWLIVLFGLQLTFTMQHLNSLDAAEIAAAKRTEDYFIANDLTAMNIAREVAAAFEKNNAPVSSEVISSKLNIPAELAEKILNHLVNSGIMIKTAEPKAGFVPARDPAKTSLSDIAEAIAKISFAQSAIGPSDNLKQITREQRDVLNQYSLKQIIADEKID
ncbi:MAG: YhjD/YihY/BrkB family envelope integrity protein [Phycisphaerae bacterium]|nr:YhjD/YihY/BrkB family envelope integrity protein [Phycisphaerae bacterium]